METGRISSVGGWCGSWMLTVLVVLLAVSNESFWIDEMTCKRIAGSGTWGAFVENIQAEGGSDSQMPLFQVMMFVWNELAGGDEWGFRLINVFLFLIGMCSMGYYLRVSGIKLFGYQLAAITSAFLWFYMNEARPYMMQFAGASSLLAGYWLACASDNANYRSSSWLLMIGGTLVCAGSSLLGAPFAGIVFLCVAYDQWKKKNLHWNAEILWLAVWAAVLSCLAIYYIWTITEGKGASAANKTSILTLGFSAFEQLGFMPFGPGRLSLREHGPYVMLEWLPMLGVWCVCVVSLLWLGIKELRNSRVFKKQWMLALLPALLMCLMLVAGGYLGGFRVLGRHFMPVYPVMLLVIGLAYNRLKESRGMTSRIFLLAVGMIAFFGCLTQRYSYRHAKDDYRGAIATINAMKETRPVIWWAAAGKVDQVYPVEADTTMIYVKNATAELLANTLVPDVVVLSKVDVYDAHGTVRSWLAKNDYKIFKELPAFKFYQKCVAEQPGR